MTAASHHATLLLVRHAKSSWADESTADIDRPLSGRGRRAAQALAGHLADTGQRPEIVLCSPARRARETLAALRDGLGSSADVRIEPLIYEGGPVELLTVLRTLPTAAQTVMVIGHNPTIQDLALGLIDPDESDELVRLREKLPTGAMVSLTVPRGWDQLRAGGARLREFWTSR